MIGRIVIAEVRPSTPSGHPAKAVVGEVVPVSADIFRDGHDILAAQVRWRATDKDGEWSASPLQLVGNDRWEGALEASALGAHEMVIEAWTDTYATWRHKVTAKLGAGQDLSAEFAEAAALLAARGRKAAKEDKPALTAARTALLDESLSAWDRLRDTLDSDIGDLLAGPGSSKELTRTKPYPLWVDRERALYGAWYELFPRSEGGLRRTADKRLPAIAEMGFDILYLPPIHP
ncbi:MAG TPA: maltotransferase domain-containing protein, partial [Acidimicrobiales bacterium]|nr:maltotransferase domain-containing protein [Acidimicrobiales bacterium]